MCVYIYIHTFVKWILFHLSLHILHLISKYQIEFGLNSYLIIDLPNKLHLRQRLIQHRHY